MTIKEQADQLVDKYRPYAREHLHGDIYATHCALWEVGARIEDFYKLSSVFLKWVGTDLYVVNPRHWDELTALQTELKSRL